MPRMTTTSKSWLAELEQSKMRQFGTGAEREADPVGFVALQNEIEVKNTEVTVDAAKIFLRQRKPAAFNLKSPDL